MKRAYSYVRFSTADQLKGDSQRRQVEAAEKWCKKNGVELVTTYTDLGVSAFKGKNAATGALSVFLALVKKKKIPKGSFLVVESLDRVSRDTILNAFELFIGIIKSGVKVVTLADNHIYDLEKISGGNFTDLIVSLTVLSRAHEESAMKKIRGAAVWEKKRHNLDKEKLTAKCVAWLKLAEDKKRFEIIPERAKIVQRIFDMAINGNGSFTICKTFNRERVPTFGYADTWNFSYIQNILKNRATIGEFVPGFLRDEERVLCDPVPNYYPAVVTRECFATVQQNHRVRPNHNGRSASENVFSKLVFDHATGERMYYTTKNPGESYLVSAAVNGGRAKYCAWKYVEFRALFLLVCEQAALQKSPDIESDNGAIAVAKMELDEVNKQLERLADFLATRGASETIEKKLRATEQTKRELESKVNELSNRELARPLELDKINWRDSDRLRENLRATVKKITVDAKEKWFCVEWMDGRPLHLFGVVNDMSDADIRAAESKRWKGIKMPLAELFDLAKKKGYLPKTYKPKPGNDTALIYTADNPAALIAKARSN
jgi:DNA invertase Pin-like site-specific DNA recombinase